MGVRFLCRGLPVIRLGGAFWMGAHFRRDMPRMHTLHNQKPPGIKWLPLDRSFVPSSYS